jgi:hypothetical protein
MYKRKNLVIAWERVRANHRAGGIDGESIEPLLLVSLALMASLPSVPPEERYMHFPGKNRSVTSGIR